MQHTAAHPQTRRADARRQRGAFRTVSGMVGKPLPHSLEAEERLLSCCLLDGSDTIALCQKRGLTGDAFYSPANRVIFEKVVDLFISGRPVDLAVVAEELKSSRQLEEVGGYAYLAQISEEVPTTVQAPYFLDRVQALARQREKIRVASGLVHSLYSSDEAAIAEHESEISELVSRRPLGLPPILKFAEFIGAEARPLPPELISGVLHQGSKLMIAGGSKSFKTWVLLDLALSISTGTPWWGMRTTLGSVLYLNLEIAQAFCERRVREIMKAKNIGEAPNFSSWHLRGYARDFRQLLPDMTRAMAGSEYKMVILDPVYKLLGDRDENSNGEVAELLNEFESLAVRTGAAVAYGHHHSKGNQAEKDARDRSSGAGAWTRDPDALIDLTPHKEDEHFTATFTLRNNPPRNPMVVRWQYPCMSTAPGLNPADLRQPGRPRSYDVTDILKALETAPNGLGYAEWEKACSKHGISESTFKRLLRQAVDEGTVDRHGNIYLRRKP